MKKLLLLVAFVAAMVVGSASAASAAGQFCYEIHVSPGDVNQADCVALP